MFRRPTGTDDILPAQQAAWRYVRYHASRVAELYGYSQIDTPSFEETALFVRGVGEGTDLIEQETYTFEDRGHTKLTLRSEGTAPVMRAYLQEGMRSLPTPVRLFYIVPIFRYDRPQKGRLREHHQFGVEAIGDAHPSMDAEVIALLSRYFAALGISGIEIQLNSIGDYQCRPAYIERLREYYRPLLADVCDNCRVRFDKNPLRLLDCKEARCQPVIARAPKPAAFLCEPCRQHYDELRTLLDAMHIPVVQNDRLVRGLGYYTRTVFEFYGQSHGAQAALGGGGRYDGLIQELGGDAVPAVGFGSGVERAILTLQEQGVPIPAIPAPLVYVCHLGDEARMWATQVAQTLRNAGNAAVATPGSRRLPAQLRQADHYGAAFAVIIGDNEVESHTVTLRNMQDKREERGLTVHDLITRLRRVQPQHATQTAPLE